MKVRQQIAYLFLAALMMLSAPNAFSQTITTGDVAGVVTDASGAVVAGATVTATSGATGETRTVTTNTAGQFRFTFLSPASYTVAAVTPGLKSDLTRVTVEVGQAIQVNLLAKVQATQQTVEVSADASLVDTETANQATTFSSKEVMDLPAPGGDITTVAFTVPGIVVSTAGGYGNFSSHGLPATSNLFTINGNDYNDPYLNLNNSGASNLTLGQNEISEASVVQNAYSVQYGRQAGAQVNFITKSGSNAFHSSLLYNYNSEVMNANDFFNNTYGVARPFSISNQYAASLGGPVKKDKLFFFVDTEGLRYTLASTGTVVVPSEQLQTYILNTIGSQQKSLYQQAFNLYNSAPGYAGRTSVTNGGSDLQDGTGQLGCGQFAGTNTVAPNGGIFGQTVSCADAWRASGSNTNSEWLLTTRADYNINDKQKINFRFKTDHGFQPTQTNLVNANLNEESIQPEYEGQVNHTYVISPTIVNNFIGSVSWYSAYFGPASVSKTLSTFPTDFEFGDGGTNAATFYQAGSSLYAFPQGRNVGQGQITDDLSFVEGKHTIKVGANIRKNKVTDSGLLAGTYGYYDFASLTDFVQGVTNPNTFSYYDQSFTTITAAHLRLYNLGIYIQDEWNALPNLKITYGMRFDRTANPTCLDNCFSRFNTDFASPGYSATIDTPYNATIQTGLSQAYRNTDAFVPQPRFGIVWSPLGASHGPVIRAGGGLFADLAPGFLVSNVFSNLPNPYGALIYNGAEVGPQSDASSAEAAALNQYNAFKTGFGAGDTLGQLNNAVPGGFAPSNFFSVQNHVGTPTYAEWSFEIQQPLGNKNVLVATYSGNHGYNLLTQNGFANGSYNAANFPTGFGGLPATSPDQRFGTITELQTNGISNYNGLSVQFRRGFGYGFQGQIGYTWSHALDDVSNDGSGLPFNGATSLTELVNPTLRNNYGNADYDIRHNLVADFSWDTPWKTNSRALNMLLGWTISGKFFARTGLPFSVVDSQLAGEVGGGTVGGSILATTIAPVSTSCGKSSINTPCFTTSQFAASGTETIYGNLGRNAFYGPGYFDVDTAIYKKINLTERIGFMLGAQAYNILNHPNFGQPGNNIVNGLGVISSTAIPPTSAYGAFQGSSVSGRVIVVTGRFTF